MIFTGERFVPSLEGRIAYEHRHRYESVRKLCAAKRVLDVACGEGYGAASLAEVATSVVGIDVDEESVSHARSTYARPNLRFVQADATDLPLGDGSIDVVVCFETLEHLVEHDSLLGEFVRVLAAGGLLIISSPNKAIYSDLPDYQNPFHVRELYFDQFEALLRAHFDSVTIYGQQLIGLSVLHPLTANREARIPSLPGDGECVDRLMGLEDPLYFVGICTNAPNVPALGSIYLDPTDSLLDDLQRESDASKDLADELKGELARRGAVRVVAPTDLGSAAAIESHLAKRRVIVAASFKPGAPYCAQTIGSYLDALPFPVAYDRFAEHNLSQELLAQFRGRPFAIDLQMRPHASNLVACRNESIAIAVLWRNLADTIVSFDNGTAEYGAANPVFYVDAQTFAALPQQQRYRFLIDSLVPWSLSFYLSWRRLPGTVLHPYERMMVNGFTFYQTMLWLLGAPIDEARLMAVIQESNMSAHADRVPTDNPFDEATRLRLERLVLDHPDFEQLEVLLWELPWEPLTLERISPCDGTVVAQRDGQPFFVSRGRRHAVDSSWLISRGPERLRTPTVISDVELGALALGAALH